MYTTLVIVGLVTILAVAIALLRTSESERDGAGHAPDVAPPAAHG